MQCVSPDLGRPAEGDEARRLTPVEFKSFLLCRSLGANDFQVFWNVTMPNIRWGLLYGIILTNAVRAAPTAASCLASLARSTAAALWPALDVLVTDRLRPTVCLAGWGDWVKLKQLSGC